LSEPPITRSIHCYMNISY